MVLRAQGRGVEYRELAQREEQLQKQVIELSEENMELKFEVEQADRDIPRLKVDTLSDRLRFVGITQCSSCFYRWLTSVVAI